MTQGRIGQIAYPRHIPFEPLYTGRTPVPNSSEIEEDVLGIRSYFDL